MLIPTDPFSATQAKYSNKQLKKLSFVYSFSCFPSLLAVILRPYLNFNWKKRCIPFIILFALNTAHLSKLME